MNAGQDSHYVILLHYRHVKPLHRIIRTSSLLQLTVELGKDGLICLRRDVNSKDMMSALEELRRRWDTLDWKPATTSSYMGPFSGFDGPYENGIFVSLKHYGNATRIVWLDMINFTHRSVNLPYPSQPTCLAMDPGQDLLVSVAFCGDGPIGVDFWDNTKWQTYLQFTDLGTAGTHPSARLRSVKLDIPAFDKDAMNDIAQLDLMDVGIVDRAVVWRLRHYGPQGYYSQVVIYNWQLGVCIYDSAREFMELRFDEFRLISDTVYLVTRKDCSDRGELLVYTFNITPGSNVQERPCLRCVLALPQHLPNIKMGYTYISYEHSSPRKSWHVDDVFSYASDEQLLILRMSYHQIPRTDGARGGFTRILRFFYELVIPTRAIHQFVREAIKMDAQPFEMYVTWNNWGTHLTRLLASEDANESQYRGLFGQKVLRVLKHRADEDTSHYPWYLRTLDFSRRQRQLESTETAQVRYYGYNDPTRVVAGPSSPFTEDVVTALPYYELMRLVSNLKTEIRWEYDQNAFIGVETFVDDNADDTFITAKFTTYRF